MVVLASCLSNAVKHYFTSNKKQDLSSDPPPLELQDVPDFDLRMLLKEVLLGLNIFPKIAACQRPRNKSVKN